MADDYDPYTDPESDLYDPYADPDSPLYDPYLDPDAPWDPGADDSLAVESEQDCYVEEVEPGKCMKFCTTMRMDAAGNIEIIIEEPEETECKDALSV